MPLFLWAEVHGQLSGIIAWIPVAEAEIMHSGTVARVTLPSIPILITHNLAQEVEKPTYEPMNLQVRSQNMLIPPSTLPVY